MITEDQLGTSRPNLQLGVIPSPLHITFHIDPGASTTEIREKIEGWLEGRDPAHGISRVILLGKMYEIPLHGQAPPYENQLVQKVRVNAAFFARFKPGYFTYVRNGSEDVWFSEVKTTYKDIGAHWLIRLPGKSRKQYSSQGNAARRWCQHAPHGKWGHQTHD